MSATAAAAPSGKPVAAARGAACQARIDTIPDGVEVRWGATLLGTTPLHDIAVPCGNAGLLLSHPRYQQVEQPVRAQPGDPSVVAIRMERPVVELGLRSVPPGAVFTVDGATIGTAPTTAPVPGYTTVQVTASLPDRDPWHGRVYIRGRGDSLTVDLDQNKAITRRGASRPR